MRKFLIVTLTLVLVLGLSGLAFAGNTAHTVKTAGTYNYAYIDQTGAGGDNNFLDSDQTARWNYNELYVYQHKNGNKALLKQVAHDYNYASITQLGGGNGLGQGLPCGSYDYSKKAFQKSTGSWNKLLLYQAGGNNWAALYQNGTGYNLADIDQRGANNEVRAYQFNSGGFNNLYVRQTGSDFARVCDNAGSNNNTIVHQ